MATKKTQRRTTPKLKVDTKLLLAVVVCIVLSAGTYFLFTKPVRADAAAVADAAAAAQGELDRNNQRITDIRSGRRSAADEVLEQGKALDRKLPASVDKVSLVASIPTLAAKRGITVNQMDPSDAATVGEGGLASQTFAVAATGTTDALAGWVADLQAYPSVVTVSGLSLTMSGAGETTATFSLAAHYVPSATLRGNRQPAN